MGAAERIDRKHERAVEEFIEHERERDPKRVDEVEQAFPVLTERELAWRRAHEVGFTQQSLDTGVLTAYMRPPAYLVADFMGRRVPLGLAA